MQGTSPPRLIIFHIHEPGTYWELLSGRMAEGTEDVSLSEQEQHSFSDRLGI